MIHDPLCPNTHSKVVHDDTPCRCEEYTKVREDERYANRTLGNTYDYDHGDQCPAYGNRRGTVYDPPCTCNGAYSRGLDDGYDAALRDAVEAVKETFWPTDGSWVTDTTTFDSMGNACVRRIEALGGER